MDVHTISRLAAALASARPEGRSEAVRNRLAEEPRCPVARYLAGCESFDRGRAAHGVRHFMIAAHNEPDFQSASLLVFAGLDWVVRSRLPLLTVLLDAWSEYRRPPIDVRRKERALLDAFEEATAPGLGALGKSLYRLPIRALRAQIRAAAETKDAEFRPLLYSLA